MTDSGTGLEELFRFGKPKVAPKKRTPPSGPKRYIEVGVLTDSANADAGETTFFVGPFADEGEAKKECTRAVQATDSKVVGFSVPGTDPERVELWDIMRPVESQAWGRNEHNTLNQIPLTRTSAREQLQAMKPQL